MKCDKCGQENINRGKRCGVCYWALYDGDWCQNSNCEMYGKSVGDNYIRLTNSEADVLIKNSKQFLKVIDGFV